MSPRVLVMKILNIKLNALQKISSNPLGERIGWVTIKGNFELKFDKDFRGSIGGPKVPFL